MTFEEALALLSDLRRVNAELNLLTPRTAHPYEGEDLIEREIKAEWSKIIADSGEEDLVDIKFI